MAFGFSASPDPGVDSFGAAPPLWLMKALADHNSQEQPTNKHQLHHAKHLTRQNTLAPNKSQRPRRGKITLLILLPPALVQPPLSP